MKSFSQDILGQLYRYDELHGTDYVPFYVFLLRKMAVQAGLVNVNLYIVTRSFIKLRKLKCYWIWT